jgi:membrane-bound lytic murein transglycosylase D
MEEIFAGENLPLGLVRLPLVESSFNVKAESKVGASGIWQIMPKTGQAYMIVNDHIDERNSPLKATKLAAKLLKQYHKALGSWPLAITAYNHGIGNIRKSMRGAKSDNLEDIIERYHQGAFKFASSNFFTCFLAALYAERYHDRLFQELEKQPLLARESVSLPNRMSLKRISQLTGLDTPTLVAYNLDLRSKKTTNKVLPRGYVLHLPPGHREKIQSRVGLEQKKPVPRS